MKKTIKALLLFTVLLTSVPMTAFAAGDDYTAPGLLTSGLEVGSAECQTMEKAEWEEKFKEDNKGLIDGKMPEQNEADEDNKFLQIVLGPFNRLLSDTFGSDETKGMISGDCNDEFSFTKHILKLTAPVKVTEFQPLMQFTKYIQMFAMTFLILFIVWYGFQYITGKQDVEDPMQFSYRMGIAIAGIMLAPRLIQDVLNINNMIVYYVASMDLPGSVGGAATAGAATLGLAGSMAIANFLAMFVTSLVSGVGLFILILGVIMLILTVIPLVKLMMWWYIRLFTILLMTVFSPIFFLFLAAEATSKMAKRFFVTFVAEIFSQVFVVIGFYFSVLLLLNYSELASAFNLGFIGLMLMLLVQVQLLAEIPSWTKRWIGGTDTPGYKQITSMVSAGIGAAVGNTFDKSLKKHNTKSAQKGFEQSNEKQHAEVSSALNDKGAWDSMNDSTGDGKTASALERIKEGMGAQTNATNKGAGADASGGASPIVAAGGQRKSVSQLINGVPKTGDTNGSNPVNQEALNRAMSDNVGLNMQSEELKGYGDSTRRNILEGAKNGTLSKESATQMLEQDRVARGENPFMSTKGAIQDRKEMERNHGITFGEKNSNVHTGGGSTASPEKSVPTYRKPTDVFTSQTMNKVQNGLENGTMHRSQAIGVMSDDLMANRGMNQVEANKTSEERMAAFEKSSPTGLGYEAQSQLNKLSKNGDLTQGHVRDIAKKDAIYNKGMKDKTDVQKHIDSVMAKGNFGETVGVTSNRQNAKVEKAPSLNLGEKVRTRGGVEDNARATTGKQTDSNYEIPNAPIERGGNTSAPTPMDRTMDNTTGSNSYNGSGSEQSDQKQQGNETDINPVDRGVIDDTQFVSNYSADIGGNEHESLRVNTDYSTDEPSPIDNEFMFGDYSGSDGGRGFMDDLDPSVYEDQYTDFDMEQLKNSIIREFEQGNLSDDDYGNDRQDQGQPFMEIIQPGPSPHEFPDLQDTYGMEEAPVPPVKKTDKSKAKVKPKQVGIVGLPTEKKDENELEEKDKNDKGE